MTRLLYALAGADKARMDEILRVDHAGEYAAVLIYRAQKAVFEGRKAHGDMVRDLSEMQDQEAAHLARFDRLLNERRVRPTAMTPPCTPGSRSWVSSDGAVMANW